VNLWLVNHYAIPPSQPGGTRHFVMARELVGRGHAATILASSFDHLLRREMHLADGETWKRGEVQGVQFVWLRTPAYAENSASRVWNMLAFAWRLWSGLGIRGLPRPDVVLGSSPHLFAAWAAQRVAARFNVPFVFEVRDLWPQSLIELGQVSPHHPLVWWLGWLERALYCRAARIIALQPGAAEHMAARGARREKVVWLPNGTDLHAMPRPTPPPSREAFTVLYAGAHGYNNDLDTLLDAAALLRTQSSDERVEIRLIGDGPERPRLARRVVDEGLEKVRIDGPLPKAEIPCALQTADCFVVTARSAPLYRHGISFNKIYDYFAAARPVVFAGDVAHNPVTEAGAGIVVPPEDPAKLAEALLQMARTPEEERWQMGLRARRFVEQHHDLRKLAGKLEEVLAGCVRSR
jgi:glycosyltransferase involved in cell wall biosynthesis